MMKKLILSGLLLSLVSVGILGGSAMAAKPVPATPSTQLLGVDVSWPQCGGKLPSNQAFGIVGVNGGLATTTNPCLTQQLRWAQKSVGGTSQERVQLYVNTANPGGLNTESWPKSNLDPAGVQTANPYGICKGDDTEACAWQYGWNRALEDVRDRFQPAAKQAGLDTIAATYVWWLDVEIDNTWKDDGSSFAFRSNVSVLEGMTAYFKSVGVRVGLYATGYQWNLIVGDGVTEGSNLNGLLNWRPGGASLATAKDACTATPLTEGGAVVLTQFVSRGIDYNYSCK